MAILPREAGYVVPMAVLKPLSGISAGKGAATPLSTARLSLTIRYLEFCLLIDHLDLGILRQIL
jgi:hypothetical protein